MVNAISNRDSAAFTKIAGYDYIDISADGIKSEFKLRWQQHAANIFGINFVSWFSGMHFLQWCEFSRLEKYTSKQIEATTISDRQLKGR